MGTVAQRLSGAFDELFLTLLLALARGLAGVLLIPLLCVLKIELFSLIPWFPL